MTPVLGRKLHRFIYHCHSQAGALSRLSGVVHAGVGCIQSTTDQTQQKPFESFVKPSISDRVDDGVHSRVTKVQYFHCHQDAHVPYECARSAPFVDQDRRKKWKPADGKNAGY